MQLGDERGKITESAQNAIQWRIAQKPTTMKQPKIMFRLLQTTKETICVIFSKIQTMHTLLVSASNIRVSPHVLRPPIFGNLSL